MLVCCIFGLTLAYVRTCINIHDLFRSCILMQLVYSLYSLHIYTGSYNVYATASVFIYLNNHFSLDARSVRPLSSVPFSINHARAFSNLCQLFAW